MVAPEPSRVTGQPAAVHAAARQRWARLLEASEGAAVGRALPRRSFAFDLLIALVFIAVGWLLLQVLSPKADADDLVFVFLINLPLVVRRRFPQVSFGIIFVIGLVQMMLGVPIGMYDAGLLFSLYSVVGYTNRRFSFVALLIGAVAVAVGAATDWWLYVDQQLAEPSRLVRVLSATGAAGLVAASWALGERLRSGRISMISLAERTEQLERDREQQAKIAAAAERARIAREMHDVIAHGLSVMIVQADGAAYVVEQSPASGKAALEQISATGRESLAQMRNLLGLLRSGTEASTVEESAEPQPGLDEVPGLIAAAESAGSHVVLTERGDRRDIPSMIELTAYRVIQEALTNARKHGGVDVQITVDHGHDHLRVIISNAPADDASRTLTGAPGHGLMGMAERVAAVGGSCRAGSGENGRFDVDVSLPYSAAAGSGAIDG